MRVPTRVLGPAALMVVLAGCSAAPRKKPVHMGPVAQGPDSLESVRRQLQGKWQLVAAETFDDGGAAATHRGDGLLTYDEFGNLTASGRLDDQHAAGDLVTFSGMAVIDTTRHHLVLTPPRGALADPHGAAPGGRRVREYLIQGDTLTLTALDGNGRPQGRTTWRRMH